MNKDKKKYDANFTAGGLLFNEFKALESLLLNPDFKKLIKLEEEENNVIGIATNSARKRIISEIKRRYDQVEIDFWTHFFEWNTSEQKLGLFYLCLKTYPLILDVHFEVVVKKFKLGQSLDDYDIQMRFDEIASQNDYVANWADITMYKLNVQYRKALKDAGIYDGSGLRKPKQIKSSFGEYFNNINESWFLEACFINI